MEIIYSEQAQEDIEYWKRNGNKVIFERITRLLADISENPYTGIGKPERLKYDLSGKWSRRIDSEHRIIYIVREAYIYILALRYHYTKK